MDNDNITLGQIIKTIGKLKYRTLIMIISIFFGIISASFAFGRFSYQVGTAVRLESPFAMRISIDGKNHDYNALTLIKDPTLKSPSSDAVSLSLREIQDSFDVIQIGIIVAKVGPSEINSVWAKLNVVSSDFSNKGYILYAVSQDNDKSLPPADFNWYIHKGDYNFSEVHIDKNTVHRTYSDGCILEYKMNDGRKSIHSSFKWIRVNH